MRNSNINLSLLSLYSSSSGVSIISIKILILIPLMLNSSSKYNTLSQDNSEIENNIELSTALSCYSS
jgi:hypothetical protein